MNQRSVAGNSPRASLVLPAFNEERGLRVTLQAVQREQLDLHIVVVDDGSTDATAAVAAEAGVQLVRHTANRGKGAALRSGVAAAPGDLIVTMDADATYPATAVQRVVELLAEHDYVSAARRTGRAHIPIVNRVGNAAIATMIRVFSGSRLADPLTGMYGLRRSAFEAVAPRSDGFGIETEIAMKAARAGLSTAQLRIGYGAREGRSKLNPIRDGFAILRTIGRLALDGRVRRRRTVP